jgi:hypothetical protein
MGTLIGQGAPYIAGAASTGWLYDSDNLDAVPVTALSAPSDLARGIGHGLTGRALANDLCPVGLAMIQKASGAETNTFTTRVAINGTLTNCNNLGGVLGASQVAGTFPAGALSLIGRTLRVRASGTCGTTGTPNLTIDIGLGAGVLATTGVLALAAVTTPAPWFMDVQATVQTAGSSGVVISEGLFLYSTTSSVVVLTWTMGNSTRGTGLSADLTTALAFTLNATCGTSNASNRIICNTLSVEVLY